MAKNGVIGNDGSQPFYLKADLKRFKQLTTGTAVVMGRKTFDAIVARLGKPLADRTNIVVTRQDNFSAPAGCIVCKSIEKALEAARNTGKQVFVIGGAQVFAQSMPFVDRLELTELGEEFKGDVFFPKVDSLQWKEVSRTAGMEDGKHFDFVSYERIKA